MIEELKLEDTDGVSILTIHRPKRRNALHAPLWTGIRDVALEIAANAPRALIITGHGEHFCSGMDLNPDNPLVMRLLSEIGAESDQGLIALIKELKSTFEAIRSIDCPVIAAIEGACVGGGLELALACDIRIASETAFFSLPETRFGMVPDLGGTVRLAQTIGSSQAAEIILSAKTLNVSEAHALGLINRVVDGGEALGACEALAQAIRGNSPAANRGALGVLRAIHSLDETAALNAETQAGARALRSLDVMEGVQAFMEKREPRWKS